VRKVVDLAFEKNLMRANAVDFKKCSIGVVDFVEGEHLEEGSERLGSVLERFPKPVLVVMNNAEGANSWAGGSMTAAGAA